MDEYTPEGGGAEQPPVYTEPTPAQARRRMWPVALIAAIVVVVLVAAGVTAGVVLTRQSPTVAVPTGAADLRGSVTGAEEYLTGEGAALAKGRTDGLTVYSVKASLDTGAETLDGAESVLYTNKTGDTLDEIVFRVYPNDPSFRGKDGKAMVIDEVKVDGRTTTCRLDRTLLTVPLGRSLASGSSTIVSLDFEEHIPQVPTGVNALLPTGTAAGYGIFGHDDNCYNLGYFIPQVASYRNGRWENRQVPAFGDQSDFPCSYFTVSLDVPDDFAIAATGIRRESKRSGGRLAEKYAAGPARDFVAQALRGYRSSSAKVGETTINSYYLESAGASGKKVLEYTRSAVEQFSGHIGPYPYKVLNVCESPMAGGAAGMEFTGQIMLAGMLYGDLSTMGNLGGVEIPDELKQYTDQLEGLLGDITGGLLGDMLEFTTVHETCHQWFALTVGSDSIASPWVDESLVNYLSALYFRWVHGAEAEQKQIDSQLVMTYKAGKMMGGGGDAVVDQPIDKFADSHQFTAIVYGKGALFFVELNKLMGDDAFNRSLKQYYGRYAFLQATPKDLLEAFNANAPDPAAAAALEKRWLEEKHGDEDISGSSPGQPGGDLLDDLMKELQQQGLDLGPLNDLLDDYLKNGIPLDRIPLPFSVPVPEEESPVI